MLKRFWEDMKKNYRYAIYSAKAELKAEVAGSYLNWIWWILEPICFMLIYTLIFGYVFNASEEYFTVFIFIGITLWDFFSRNLKNSVKMVKKNKPIVTKVYIPKFILILSKMLVNGFKMLVSFGIVVLMMIIYRVPVSVNLIYVIPLLIDVVLLCFGIMCILLHFGVYVEDLANVVNIALKLMFYLTGIFFSIETRIGKRYPALAALLEKANPMAYIITGMRKSMIYSQTPDLLFMGIWFVISLIVCIIGIRVIYKNENSYVKVI